MEQVLRCTLLSVALCAVAVAPASGGPLAMLHAGPAAIEWQPLVESLVRD